MGLDCDFRKSYLKSQISAGSTLPTAGKVFVSVKNADKRGTTTLARRLGALGCAAVATAGTAHVLERQGMSVEITRKVGDHRPNVIDLMKDGQIQLVFNTPEAGRARKDSCEIRRTAVTQDIPYHLTLDGAQAAIGAIEALLKGEQQVRSLQEDHADASATARSAPP